VNSLTKIATDMMSTVAPGKIDNPFEPVTPDFNVFGVKFTGAVELLLGGVWGAVLIWCAFAVLIGFGKWAWARQVSHNKQALSDGASEAKQALVVFACVALVSVIIGAIITFAQQAGA
jgi:hypothetical protein